MLRTHTHHHLAAVLTATTMIAVGLALSSASLAATPVAKSAPGVKVELAPIVPVLSPPQVSLKITPGSGAGAWLLKIENTGDVPVRIPADARLLSLEVTPPASSAEPDPKTKKIPAVVTSKCVLPDDARPASDEGRDLVIPSKRTWSALFDPLFYCFGAKERAALVSGASVKARFGWPVATNPNANAKTVKPAKEVPPSPPFAVTPVGAGVGKVASIKSIDAESFALTEALTINSAASTSANSNSNSENGDASTAVTLTVPETMDAARGVELGTTISLSNASDRAITLLYRPDLIQFTVSTPAGIVSCGLRREVAAPIRELFTTVGVKARSDLGVLITAVCPAGTFDEAGLYRVTPRLDTTGASGRGIGLKTWDGVAASKQPLLIRVRSPRKVLVPTRPSLD